MSRKLGNSRAGQLLAQGKGALEGHLARQAQLSGWPPPAPGTGNPLSEEWSGLAQGSGERERERVVGFGVQG